MVQPSNTGYAIPTITPTVSPAASGVLGAAVLANPSSHALLATSRVIFDQKDLPCCVSCALSAAMEVRNPDWPELSPLFHYYVTRYDDLSANSDGFLSISDSLASLSASGICAKSQHSPPFTSAGATTKPTTPAYADGRNRTLGRRGFRRRYSFAAGPSKAAWARDQLARNYPIIIGIRLPMAYPDGFLNRQFEWRDPNMPLSNSGHCVLAIGYNDARQALRIQDSRGPKSFDGGRWWMSYGLLDSSVVQEAYCLLP
jgi:hypothetical protein